MKLRGEEGPGTTTKYKFVLNPVKVLHSDCYHCVHIHIYLLLAECEVRMASYGPSFFLPFMAQARSARAMKTRKEKTKIHNLPYGPSK